MLIVGLSTVGGCCLLVALASGVFFRLSDNIRYNPCLFHVYKDDYKQFIIAGMLHSLLIAIHTSLQLFADYFPVTVAKHFFGSIQILSTIPSIVYYHVLVIIYKYRFLHVRSLGHASYRSERGVDTIFFFVNIIIFGYTPYLFLAELSYPNSGIYALKTGFIDPITGVDAGEFLTWNFLVSIFGSIQFLTDFYRITKNSSKVLWMPPEENTTEYRFRYHISQNVVPHYINDFVALFMPAVYLIVDGTKRDRLNEWDLFAKCLLIIHPVLFVITYMVQIKLATGNAGRDEMECRCSVCQKKDMKARNNSRLIRLRVMGSAGGVRGAGADSGEEGGAAGTGDANQPTETTPAIQMEVIEEL